MEYIALGNAGIQVSRLCLGTMGFGRKIDKTSAARALDEALDNGVNIVDTAESYGTDQPAEEIIGDLLSNGRRDKVYVASKVFRRRAADGHCGRNSRSNILHSLDLSLRRLQTDYIDLYQLHHPDPDTPIEETLSTLDDLVRTGKIRYVGVSNHFAWQMAYMLGVANRHGWEPMVSYQMCYNLLDRPVEVEAVPFCRKFNVATMAYSPLCGGMLSGKYKRNEPPPAKSRVGEWGKKMLAFHEDSAIHDMLDEMRKIAQEQDVTLNQLAVQWLLSKPYVATVILGGSRPDHYSPMYDIADKRLPDDVVEKMDAITSRQVYKRFMNQPYTDGPNLALQR